MSRRSLPKQFLPLVAERTMLQETVRRVGNVPGCVAPMVVSHTDHRFIVAEQLQALGVRPDVQILEPAGRNTAPAVAVAALHASRTDPDGLLLVLPSDHIIVNEAAFHDAIAAAVRDRGEMHQRLRTAQILHRLMAGGAQRRHQRAADEARSAGERYPHLARIGG